ncbi:MAG: PDZ domain-containing protein [Bdellovibrionales bacterium]|nr:PDZ domain-containing protein [Bdellovibrionales bacterium]
MKFLEYVIERNKKIVNTLGTIIVAWMCSGIASNLLASMLPNPSERSNQAENLQSVSGPRLETSRLRKGDYVSICKRNIFDSSKQTPCEKAIEPIVLAPREPEIDPNAKPVRSSISATLLGTMVSSNPKASFASIQERGEKDSKNYYIDDKILGEADIYDIQRNRVYFYRNGRREYLEVNKIPNVYSSSQSSSSTRSGTASSGIRKQGGKIFVTREKVDATLGDLNNVVQQARMVPNFNAGKVDGFKVFGIRGGSIFQELGLKNGDVINQINGTLIDSIEKAIPMLQLLKTESSYSIDVTRGGSKQTLQIEIQ